MLLGVVQTAAATTTTTTARLRCPRRTHRTLACSFVAPQLYESCRAAAHKCTIERVASHSQKKCLSHSKRHKVFPEQTLALYKVSFMCLDARATPRGPMQSLLNAKQGYNHSQGEINCQIPRHDSPTSPHIHKNPGDT
ncbi:hypothetical protein E2C01_020799 [Portunus trituberculatus]|uniref:Uncharacterized protein n=1 Tax=Portunus trituberculatus TaxID=210409 RepID=A0A5B7E2J4_PORTR|nr:hypothetical protein [Portunus trituberculatus]